MGAAAEEGLQKLSLKEQDDKNSFASSDKLEAVPECIEFPKMEELILKLWSDLDVFKSCLKQSEKKKRYSFYDGPPFATGLPHYGHILAGTIKDIVTRYAHQSGYHVERRFGWDCHGLPVEYEIDKALTIKGPEDVHKMGIKAYNDECRKIVMRYSTEWKNIITRLGRWIDFENDYKTLYPTFMESVWWVFKQIYDKGFVYRGFKIMPFSTACCTPLSNFETSQNYKDVVDPSVVVTFPLISKPSVALLGWTTTPWTLPSNLATCVHPDYEYVHIEEEATKKQYILMECRLSMLYKNSEQFRVIDKFPGSKLKGEEYEPLFDYFIQYKKQGAFRVMVDSYVTQDSGTGVVHQAPYFGADDYRICLENGVIRKDQEMVCPVDFTGHFVEPVKDFLGQYVKDADKAIIAHLKSKGRLVLASTIKHSYPFCWRSDTPLIYRAIPCWFIRVEPIVDKLLECNQQTYWVPDFVKEKRFGNWLRDAHDWAVSRNRYWGTPIPIWASEDLQEVICVGSIEELEALTGVSGIKDLHRESVDHLQIPSKREGYPPLKRISEVFDCWFESGSMPYAQNHYPFERKKEFEESFPADFIAEGVDQTRGWFYTLLVISTALYGKPPFKNVVVNGLVLASDGQKMSKRKKNYPDPVEIVHKYGADALRLYLINSPVVRGENLKFKEDGVFDLLKEVFLPWFNAYRYFVQNVIQAQTYENQVLQFDDKLSRLSKLPMEKWNVMDRWIISSVQSLVAWFEQEMTAYRLYTVTPRLVRFVSQLTNWYVRLNRRRFKNDKDYADVCHALEVLFYVLCTLCRLMAPFTPFLTEYMYQNLKSILKLDGLDSKAESIHYLMLPKPNKSLVDLRVEETVAGMQSVIELGRLARDRRAIPTKFPLTEIIVLHSDPKFLEEVRTLEKYILEELNVRTMTLSSDKKKYNVHLKAEPNHRVLGAQYKAEFKDILKLIKALGDVELEDCLKNGGVAINGNFINSADMYITYTVGGVNEESDLEPASSGGVLVILNTRRDQSLEDEGIAREIINRIQKLRKKAHLVPTDEVDVICDPKGDLEKVFQGYRDYIADAVKTPVWNIKQFTNQTFDACFIKEEFEIKGEQLMVGLAKPQVYSQ